MDFRFNDANLKANREGRLSDAQRKRLEADLDIIKRRGRNSALFLWAALTLIGEINFVAQYQMLHQDITQFIAMSALAFVPITLMAVLIYAVTTVIIPWSLIKGTVSTAEGTASPETLRAFNASYYRVILKTDSETPLFFQFQDPDALTYFKEGQPYRVYYIGSPSPYMLSVEPLVSGEHAQTFDKDQ